MNSKLNKYLIILFLFLVNGFCFSNINNSNILMDIYETQDVNGFMPEKVYIRTMTQTYCKGYNFVVVDGRIYCRKDNDKKWSLFMGSGVPFSKNKRSKSYFKTPSQIREICADADTLFAFDEQGILYHIYISKGVRDKINVWEKKFGWPKNDIKTDIFIQNELCYNKRGWSMGARRTDILWYTDIFGNEHHYGTMGLETIYFLTEDGTEIRFTDSGLPCDLSRAIEGPLEGKFIAENISVSGDTIFLIGDDGTMYTRLIDFDTMGCDPMFFKYTYDYEKQKYPGTDYRSNYSPWGLPAEPWKKQPDIIIENDAKLTKAISIAQTGKGNNSRCLRVAGTDKDGNVGYYEKMLTETTWVFHQAPLTLSQSIYLKGNSSISNKSKRLSYSGYIAKNDKVISGVECTLDNVSLTSEGKTKLTISKDNEVFCCTLYNVEMWTYLIRNNPGYDGTARNYFLTPEFDEKILDSYSETFATLLKDFLGGVNHKLFAFSAEANNQYFQIEAYGKENKTVSSLIDNKNQYVFFLTTVGSKTIHPETFKSALFLYQPLMRKAESPELTLESGKEYTIRDRTRIISVIEKNKQYKYELISEIKKYRNLEKNANKSRWGYNAADLITSITFLNRIDFPKIKTITTFGGEIMNTNADYFANLLSYKEAYFVHIMELVDLRIQNMEKILDDFAEGEYVSILNARLKNSFNEYTSLIKLPQVAYGFSETGNSKAHCEQVTFVPYFPGYILQLDDESNTSITVELQECAKIILARDENLSLKEVPVEIPVSFQITTLKDSHLDNSNIYAGIANIENKQGKLIWDGDKIRILIKDNLLSTKELFSGK